MADETPEVWPPAPKPPAGTAKTCPACARKLLTQTSMLCNWCGAKIDDPDYLARAAEARHEMDAAERAQVDALTKEEAKFGVLGRLRRRAKTNSGPKSGNDLTL